MTSSDMGLFREKWDTTSIFGTAVHKVGEWFVIKFDIDGAEVTIFTLSSSNYDKNAIRDVDQTLFRNCDIDPAFLHVLLFNFAHYSG